MSVPDLSYDAEAPYDVVVTPVAERPGVAIAECRFDNVEGDPVDAYLVSPVDTPPRAGVVFQHSTGGRGAFLAEAIRLAEAGGIGLCLPVTFQASGELLPMIRQSIFAIRRGAAILLRHTERLGCVGHSAGAMMAAVVSGIDRRFECFVYEVGMSGLSFHIRDSQHPMWQARRATTPPDELDALLAEISPYDAVHFVGEAAGTPALFQAARFDIGVTAAEYQTFFDAGSDPKELHWYDSGHEASYDVAAQADRARFLAAHLDLPALPGTLADRVG
ncbi:prolyl oligopeptidase family protein [Herbihabitans rhizosphaerae]|uniref:Prolyl oligopeptidase family protein n=1 Tax=Herbihabitans rhizosphaerae TaxID=1872711 RepID=A0A4Q7KLI2_9PSEU|nr:prolyl oligopeptidase family serine peptidase [Herbihabitans rhizosphaerae]RZS37104.1 prolyl oligopeptidase family protein [Herbihabitans rhizosphaerae]